MWAFYGAWGHAPWHTAVMFVLYSRADSIYITVTVLEFTGIIVVETIMVREDTHHGKQTAWQTAP
jgi:hypothetical protein